MKLPRRRKTAAKPKKTLDMFSEKQRRGRPGVRASEIAGRSYHYRLLFSQIWDSMGEKLLQAKTEADVVQAFGPVPYYTEQFAPIASVVLKVLRDPKFPKTRQARINFLADSLAGRGRISPRRSRDISAQERARKARAHYIIRRDYYIECTCRYRGPALHGKCPKCGTDKLSLPLLKRARSSVGFSL